MPKTCESPATSLLQSLLWAIILLCVASPSDAQTSDSVRARLRSDSTIATQVNLNPASTWRRPTVQHQSSAMTYSRDAIRYYESPATIGQLLDASPVAYPLMLGAEGYGREAWISTNRTSEAPIQTEIEGFLPINSALNGVALANEYPLGNAEAITLDQGARGVALAGATTAGSDNLLYTIERFRAPVPYSRVQYTQDLTRNASVFEALFSVNASRHWNTALGLYRRTSGQAPDNLNPTYNPRTDLWSLRGQLSFDNSDSEHVAGPHSTALLWGQYTTAFTGESGGIMRQDSGDIFDDQSASVINVNTYAHRVRADALAELTIPLLAESPTKLGAFYSYEARRILARDSTFPTWPLDVSVGSRIGATLEQPLALSVGDFATRAIARGDILRIARDSLFPGVPAVSDARIAGLFSDSLAWRSTFHISLYGFAKLIESNVTLNDGVIHSAVFPSVGATGTIGFSKALSFTASYLYARDRATLSPAPLAQYELHNVLGALALCIPLGGDSLAIHASILDRHEPEGIVPNLASDSISPQVTYSARSVHSQSTTVSCDLFLGPFHFGTTTTYFPAFIPVSSYTEQSNRAMELSQRFFGNVVAMYERELQDGNLRISTGARLRFLNRLEPTLTYDPASDYYLYRGLAVSGNPLAPATWLPLDNAALRTPKGLLDLLLTAEVDRRAQISLSLLNVLDTPYYVVTTYPWSGFSWKLSVTWAFLD